MAITHLHIRFAATRLLLVETLRLHTDAVLWRTAVEERLIELRASDDPGAGQAAKVVEEYVGNPLRRALPMRPFHTIARPGVAG